MSVRSGWMNLESRLVLDEPESHQRDLKAESRLTSARSAELRRESEEIRAHSAELFRRAALVLERARRLQKQDRRPDGDSLPAAAEAATEEAGGTTNLAR